MRATDAMMTVEVPARSPIAHPNCAEMREITILKKPARAGNPGKTIWIASRDLCWFLVALAEENALGGVTVDDGAAVAAELLTDDSQETVPASACRGVQYTWDWAGHDGYVADVTRGPHEGKEIASRVSTLTETKWNNAVMFCNALQETCQGKTLHEASEAERRSAALVVLQLHCEGLMEAEKGD